MSEQSGFQAFDEKFSPLVKRFVRRILAIPRGPDREHSFVSYDHYKKMWEFETYDLPRPIQKHLAAMICEQVTAVTYSDRYLEKQIHIEEQAKEQKSNRVLKARVRWYEMQSSITRSLFGIAHLSINNLGPKPKVRSFNELIPDSGVRRRLHRLLIKNGFLVKGKLVVPEKPEKWRDDDGREWEDNPFRNTTPFMICGTIWVMVKEKLAPHTKSEAMRLMCGHYGIPENKRRLDLFGLGRLSVKGKCSCTDLDNKFITGKNYGELRLKILQQLWEQTP